jgi:hypothetical protein
MVAGPRNRNFFPFNNFREPCNHFKIRRPGTGARPFLLESAQEIIDLVAVLNAVRVALPPSKLQDF